MNRVALIGIMVQDKNSSAEINEIFSSYSEYIVGRMGIPNAGENLNVISIVINAPSDIISSVSGKLGQLKGVNSKTIYAKQKEG